MNATTAREIIMESISYEGDVKPWELARAKRVYEDEMLRRISKVDDIRNNRI